MTPEQYCQQKVGASGSSFYYSFLFLPAPRRAAITALYAFCREVDDAVDECAHPEIATAKLAWWRDEIANLYAGNPAHPVARALSPAVRAYDLPHAHFSDIIDGMAMDLGETRYATFAALREYCYRVASAVGLLSARIFGYTDPRTLSFAEELGIAFQLTNIIRDVGEDALLGRIYLPQEDLRRFGVAIPDILHRRDSPELHALMAFQAGRAYEYYERALACLPAADRMPQLPSLIMARIYRANLDEIAADGYRVLDHKVTLPALRKLWLAWTTARRERASQRRRKQAPATPTGASR